MEGLIASPNSRVDAVEANRNKILPYLLFALALGTDLLTPFLIWKGVLPPFVRWLSHAAVAAMMFGVFVRMVVFNRFPRAIWLIIWMSALGVVVALLHGQGVVPTIWGWWLMYQYPLVALFAFLQPFWPTDFPRWVTKLCLIILGAVVVVQIGQYFTGQTPGDDLAGLFGWHGTGNLILFISVALSLALGRWLANREWKPLVWAVGLGIISSTLGEMKLFIIILLMMGGLTVTIFSWGESFWKNILYAAVLMLAFGVFVMTYNEIVPGANSVPLEAYVEDPELLLYYLNRVGRGVEGGSYTYDVGRNFALAYGWRVITSDPMVFVFGMGLGARGESNTLGTSGVGLGNELGLATGTSLLVMMQELGMLGMIILLGFLIWVVLKLLRDVRNTPESEASPIRFALLLFTIMWPVWLWYNTAWTLRVPMLLYWSLMGYAMREAVNTKRLSKHPSLQGADVG